MRNFTFEGLNKPIDVSQDFATHENAYFNVTKLADFDPQAGQGVLQTQRYQRKACISYNQTAVVLEKSPSQYFPPAYAENLTLPVQVSFVSERTLRLRVDARNAGMGKETPSLILDGPVPQSPAWRMSDDGAAITYAGPFGRLVIHRDPFRLELYDESGRRLTRTQHMADSKSQMNIEPTPWQVAIRTADLARRVCASFELSPAEKIFGCGESFTRLDKRGQRLVMYTHEPIGAMTDTMYKPVPFFLSSRGYGMFVHTAAPLTLDFGHRFDDSAAIYSGDDVLDLFIFLGKPAEVLGEYTALTGRSPLPPLWSFGLWMSRIWRESAEKVRDSAANYRRRKIPCDVIHWDLGWYREPWFGGDWSFSNPNFPDPKGLLKDLAQDGFRVSLWQNTYLTPGSPLFREALDKGYAILDADGRMCTDDAIIDLSNPAAVTWYQDKLQRLLELGVAVIKVDFGEAAPVRGLYASGRSGFYEHNLYVLRYNQAVAEVTGRVTGYPFIWARCAWAGSQRYPLHWGGDAESTDAGLAASVRAGLSMGLSGFAFWSHDVGGFVAENAPPAGLMTRWLMFGLLSSHTRVHGKADKEPWVHYDEAYVEQFRRQVEFRYRLLPYIYAQAAQCSLDGTPMIRALLLDYPQDPTSWLIEDEYLFGRDMLVAPLLEDEPARQVYLPPGEWIDYQTRKVYAGGQWHCIQAGPLGGELVFDPEASDRGAVEPLPAVVLVRAGAMIPHITLAQCTDRMDWSKLEAMIFATGQDEVSGLVMLPGQTAPVRVAFKKQGAGYRAVQDSPASKVTWQET